MSSMNRSEPPLKKVKVEHEPDGPFGCPFCFESCRGRGKGIDGLVCKGCQTTLDSACVKGWDGTCPKCRTDERLEVFEMPKVPMGQVVIKVEGKEGRRRRRRGLPRKRAEDVDVEDVRGRWGGVQDESRAGRTEAAQGLHSRHRRRMASLP